MPARENSMIIIGKENKFAEYNYTDSVEINLFEIDDKKEISGEIYEAFEEYKNIPPLEGGYD